MSASGGGASPGRLVNIGPAGQRQRRLFGFVAIAIAVAVTIEISRADATRWWRLGVFPFWVIGGLGLLQAHAKTCVALAALGTCDGEIGRGLNPVEAQILKRQARGVIIQVAVLAIALTLLTLALP